MLLYKAKNNNRTSSGKGNRLLISITVLGSAGPIRFVVNEEELVANVIDTALKLILVKGGFLFLALISKILCFIAQLLQPKKVKTSVKKKTCNPVRNEELALAFKDPNVPIFLVPVDLVIDHSVQVDVARSENAVQANMELEFQRNKQGFAFLKWGSNAFRNMLVVPPGSGIVHQLSP